MLLCKFALPLHSCCDLLRMSGTFHCLHRKEEFFTTLCRKVNRIQHFTMTSTPVLYRSVESILSVFNKSEHKDADGVKKLVEIYETTYDKIKKFEAVDEAKKYPLIVLEGLDGCGKTTVGKRFAKKLNAEQWRTPPTSIHHLRHLLDDSAVLRTAYYSLGNYIAALEVQMLLRDKPVVMDRFWHSTCAYAIAQAVADHPGEFAMPPAGDKIYCWPEDLFKPDAVLLLEVSENVRIQRLSRRVNFTTQENLLQSCGEFRQNVLQAYKNMTNPGVQIINGNYAFGSVLRQMETKVTSFLP